MTPASIRDGFAHLRRLGTGTAGQRGVCRSEATGWSHQRHAALTAFNSRNGASTDRWPRADPTWHRVERDRN